MKRTFALVILIIGIVKVLDELGLPYAPVVAFLLFFVTCVITQMSIGCFLGRYKRRASQWLKENGYNYKYLTPEVHFLGKGKLGSLASDAQIVMSLKNSEKEEFWFLGGDWWFGVLSKNMRIYRVIEGRLELVEQVFV